VKPCEAYENQRSEEIGHNMEKIAALWKAMGCERGMSGSQTGFSRTANPLLPMTLSIGTVFH
jgi:hypothetical protein